MFSISEVALGFVLLDIFGWQRLSLFFEANFINAKQRPTDPLESQVISSAAVTAVMLVCLLLASGQSD